MKKILALLIISSLAVLSCKKDDKNVAIDLTLKRYSADYTTRGLPNNLILKFDNNGKARLSHFVTEDTYTELNYSVADNMAAETTLKITGTTTIDVGDFKKGDKVDWTASISRLGYKPEVTGFTFGSLRFTAL